MVVCEKGVLDDRLKRVVRKDGRSDWGRLRRGGKSRRDFGKT